MIGLRRALWALGALGVIAGAALIPLGATSGHLELRGLWIALALLAGWGFIGAGLLVWYQRPENGLGGLMVATGFAWFLASLTLSDVSLVFTIGSALSVVFYAPLVHLLLSFPDGNLHSRLERIGVAVTYFIAIVPFPLLMMVVDFTDIACAECPANAFLVERNDALADAGIALLNLAGAALSVLVIVLLWRRWRVATAPQRRTLRGVLLPGLVVMALLAVSTTMDAAGASDVSVAVGVAATAAFAMLPYIFLGGLARGRIVHGGAVRELVARLSEAPAPGELQDALRRALGDPTLEVRYWISETNRYVDEHGAPSQLPVGPGRSVTLVERDGARVAAMVHDSVLDEEEPELLRAVAAAAALALDNERLEAELRCTIEDLRSSGARLLEVGFTERRRLERNLHDGAQQRLVSLALNMRMARSRLRDDPDGAERLLDSAGGELQAALEELRELARGIHPAVLSDRGLDAALESLAARAPLPVDLDHQLGEGLPGPVELAAYFVVAEALTNVVKYASASRATVRAERDNGSLTVEISDDGVGGAHAEEGSGLRGLADRLSVLDGRLEVESEPGHGTIVRARIPCA